MEKITKFKEASKMKVSIIAPIGLSPPVATEALQYVQEALFQKVSDLTIIATKEEQVKAGVELIKQAVKDRYPHVHIHEVYLPFTDIDTQEKNDEFMKIAAKILKEQKEKHKVDIIYICVAGGRKDICIEMALLAQFFNVNSIFHIVMPDVKAFNIALERVRHEIKELAKTKDKETYYKKNKEKFDPVMYPSLKNYSVIRIPILPFPRGILTEICRLLGKPGGKRLEGIELDEDYLRRMKEHGLIRKSGHYVYPTEEGFELAKLLKELI